MVNSVEKRKFHCRLLNGTFAASFFNFRLFFLVDSSKYTFIKSSRWLDLNLDHLSTKVTALSTVPQPLLNQNKLFWFLENLRRFPPKNVQNINQWTSNLTNSNKDIIIKTFHLGCETTKSNNIVIEDVADDLPTLSKSFSVSTVWVVWSVDVPFTSS